MVDESKKREDVDVKDTAETKLLSLISELEPKQHESAENLTALSFVQKALATLKSRPAVELPKHLEHPPKAPDADKSVPARPATPRDTEDAVTKTNKEQKSGKK